ncbi:hypothetical protein [Shewanella algicola]|uniref:hypothetical protein n=1 Tax=Shewanella algicola TaxID=640633 RepID=UPI00249556F2|nr:hypothetical protein [Shewanella algicola]
MTLNPITIGLLSLSLFAAAGAFANPPGGKPPQEAIDACASSSENSQVRFETPRGDSIQATCQMINGELVAVPDNPPQDMQQGQRERN